VTCVDVGRAQLHGKLLREARIVNLEGVNARHLDVAALPTPPTTSW
jgi:23S rRNA (cytidine1920-2'-O)/16S rRNA (cytidine1409-2'-O)-methyltransferase